MRSSRGTLVGLEGLGDLGELEYWNMVGKVLLQKVLQKCNGIEIVNHKER